MATIEDGFRRTLASFSAQLAPEQMEDFKFTKLEDVQVAVVTIQAQQEKRKEMMNMKRIQSFLEAMNGFGKVVEVFLNSSMFLPFIWGPIKFLLQVRLHLNDCYVRDWLRAVTMCPTSSRLCSGSLLLMFKGCVLLG